MMSIAVKIKYVISTSFNYVIIPLEVHYVLQTRIHTHTHTHKHAVLFLAFIWQVVLAMFLNLLVFSFRIYEAKFMLLTVYLTGGLEG